MDRQEIITDLFKTEYRKMISALRNRFVFADAGVPEDIVSDTFLSATELWEVRGVPENPRGWLYHVAKNKAINHLKRSSYFQKKLLPELQYSVPRETGIDADFSKRFVADGQLATLFSVCAPFVPVETQTMLAMNVVFGFDPQEIADALRTNREVVYKRIQRAKAKLRSGNIRFNMPTPDQVIDRLDMVLKILHLVFLEGYSSTLRNRDLSEDLYAEAMHLTFLLTTNRATDKPPVNALLALMCFYTSRGDGQVKDDATGMSYREQDESHWDKEMIAVGEYYLKKAAAGNTLSEYHLEAAIAYWHTRNDSEEKRESIRDLNDKLLKLGNPPLREPA